MIRYDFDKQVISTVARCYMDNGTLQVLQIGYINLNEELSHKRKQAVRFGFKPGHNVKVISINGVSIPNNIQINHWMNNYLTTRSNANGI